MRAKDVRPRSRELASKNNRNLNLTSRKPVPWCICYVSNLVYVNFFFFNFFCRVLERRLMRGTGGVNPILANFFRGTCYWDTPPGDSFGGLKRLPNFWRHVFRKKQSVFS